MRRILHVIPHVGIGALKLGMSPEQILEAIHKERSRLFVVNPKEMQISRNREEVGFTLRYLGDVYFFMVHYIDNRAVEISVNRQIDRNMDVVLFDMNVFDTEVEEVVRYMKQFSPCVYDFEDEQMSTEYEFPEIGIRFWREHPFHRQLLLDEVYMDEMSLVIEDMYQYLFFEMVTVRQESKEQILDPL